MGCATNLTQKKSGINELGTKYTENLTKLFFDRKKVLPNKIK